MDAEGSQVLCGGIDGGISAYDLRGLGARGAGGGGGAGGEPLLRLPQAHGHGVCSLAVSPDGARALSFSLDGALRSWDVRPFCGAPTRLAGEFAGAAQGAEAQLVRAAWSPDGERVACGSADRVGRVWDVASGAAVLELPGHTGTVMEACFHPSQQVIATCGDKTVWLSEVRSA